MKKHGFLFLITLALISCEGPQRATSINHAFLYNKSINRLHPQFKIFHVNDTESNLDFLIDASELLYMKGAVDTVQRANIYLQIILHTKFETTEIVDSASTKLSDLSDGKNDKFIHGEIKFKATYPNTYSLQVLVTDMNRKISYKTYLDVDKSNKFNAQNFKVVSEDGREFFGSDIGPKDKIRIISNNRVDHFTVKYFNQKFHLPAPVFSTTALPPSFPKAADSTFTISASDNAPAFTLPKEGTYLVQTDASQNEGVAIQRFYEGYPDVTNADLLVNALRYVTNKEEFGKMHNSANKKEAVDKFWLDLAGNEDRAKELISKYYNRVQDANRYFSSYTEGWRTDRGMVYLIFGPPQTIYKNGSSESWVYGEKHANLAITFIFVHQKNIFTDNDFQLRREPDFKAPWYRAVETWRQGKMYSD